MYRSLYVKHIEHISYWIQEVLCHQPDGHYGDLYSQRTLKLPGTLFWWSVSPVNVTVCEAYGGILIEHCCLSQEPEGKTLPNKLPFMDLLSELLPSILLCGRHPSIIIFLLKSVFLKQTAAAFTTDSG